MNKLTLPTLALVLAGSISTAAIAQAGPGGLSFEGLDSDSNGEITNEEFVANFPTGGGSDPARVFGLFDTDSNEIVSKEEFDNRPAAPTEGARGARGG